MMADYYDEQEPWYNYPEELDPHGEETEDWPEDEAWHEDPDRKREEMRDGD